MGIIENVRNVGLVGLLSLTSCGALSEKVLYPNLEKRNHSAIYHGDINLNHPVNIIGEPKFVERVKHILDKLYAVDKNRYHKVISYVKVVHHTGHSSFDVKTGIFTVGSRFTDDVDDIIFDMSDFVHEACHAECYEKGLYFKGMIGEGRAIDEQNRFLIEQNWHNGVIDKEKTLATRYWEDKNRID
ncbi:MAG: hypothetical protein Q8Q42_04065 [Nanoarchaeota archaeon]|nr:hypothetical protein [Nanoarchaeota archaeon]